jgi:hypothetical protein
VKLPATRTLPLTASIPFADTCRKLPGGFPRKPGCPMPKFQCSVSRIDVVKSVPAFVGVCPLALNTDGSGIVIV